MIDLLYSYRRRQFLISDVKTPVQEYINAFDLEFDVSLFQLIYDNYSTSEDLLSFVTAVRDNLRLRIDSNQLVNDSGDTLLSNVSMLDIAKYIYSHKNSNSAHPICSSFIYNYALWFYEALQEMFECIVNNGSISDLTLVGPRTKDFLLSIGSDKVIKRFGSPSNYLALPLSFSNNKINLSGPPMTTRTYGKYNISFVYNWFGMTPFYHSIGTTYFARPIIKNASTDPLVPINAFSRKEKLFRNENDVNPSFVYDLLVLLFLQKCTNQSFNIDRVYDDINALSDTSHPVDSYFKNLSFDCVPLQFAHLITMCY